MTARRHAAALTALAGWLLMTAPLQPLDGDPRKAPRDEVDFAGMVNVEAPIAEWKQDEAYDTAHACERAKREAVGRVGQELREAEARYAELDDDDPRPPGHSPTFLRLWRAQIEEARCVPSDHLYPLKCPPGDADDASGGRP
jgi:hypothetical protein